MKAHIKIAYSIDFSYDSPDRPHFESDDEKRDYFDKLFNTNWVECSYNENSTLNSVVNVPISDKKGHIRNAKYVVIKTIWDEEKYYFVDSVKIMNSNVAKMSLSLDTISTYLKKLMLPSVALNVKRRHFDRFVNKDGNLQLNLDAMMLQDDLPVDSFVSVDSKPINVLAFTSIGKFAKFWPIALMDIKHYNSGPSDVEIGSNAYRWISSKIYTDETGTGYATIPLNVEFVDSNGHMPSIDQGWWAGNNDGSSKNYSHIVPASSTNLSDKFASYIKKIIVSPLPLWPEKWIKTGPILNGIPSDDIYLKLPDVFTDVSTREKKSKLAYQLLYTFEKSKVVGTDGTAKEVSNYSLITSNMLPNGVESSGGLVEPYRYLHNTPSPLPQYNIDMVKRGDIVDPKLYTSQHYKLSVVSVNGKKHTFPSEAIFGLSNISLNISHSYGWEGVTQTVKLDTDNPIIRGYNHTELKTMVVSYKDQFPSASSAYENFMKENGSTYKTAMANNRRAAFTGFATAAETLNPLAALSVGTSFANRNASLMAKATDLHSRGITTEVDDVSIFKDITTLTNETAFGDSKLAYLMEEHPNFLKKQIDSHYKMFGYPSNFMEYVTYSTLMKRVNYTYWEVDNFKESIMRFSDSTPIEVINDIDERFKKGVRFWKADDNIGDFEQPNYESWM